MNSRDKGQRGERELAEYLRQAGYEARRGAQFSGANGDPDVVCSVPGIHIEVKRTEKLRLWEAILQAVRDAKGGRMPTVWHRANRQPWLVTLRASDFIELLKR